MNSPKELNDSLDDLLGRPAGEVRAEPIRAPTNYTPKTFSEPCPKCRGTGRYNAPSSHGSHCFECKGAGKLVFKSSPEKRAKAKTSAHARKAKLAAEAAAAKTAEIETFKVANPAVYGWLVAKAPTYGFAASLLAALNQWGDLTDGQFVAVGRSIVKDAERKVEIEARAAAAPAADTAGIDRLKLAFDTAIANAKAKGLGLKMPRITIGGMTISPAKATSTNPGALYVKNTGEYIGKIQNGRFFGVRACTEAQEKQVLAFIADPNAAAKAYGTETGVCCICNATLTSKWRLRGIGPICSTKFGW